MNSIRFVPDNIHSKSEFLLNLEGVEIGKLPITDLLTANPRLGKLEWDVDIPALNEMGLVVCEFSRMKSIDDIQEDPEDVLYNVLWFISEVENGRKPRDILMSAPTVFTYQHLELVIKTCDYLLLGDYVPFGVKTLTYKCMRLEYNIDGIFTSIIHHIEIEKWKGHDLYSDGIFEYYKREISYLKCGISIIDNSQELPDVDNVICVDTRKRIREADRFMWW
jgi:hypothetical protein